MSCASKSLRAVLGMPPTFVAPTCRYLLSVVVANAELACDQLVIYRLARSLLFVPLIGSLVLLGGKQCRFDHLAD